jgi:PhoH-like ATPase
MKGNPLCCQITLTADECEHSDPATDAVRRVKEKKYE